MILEKDEVVETKSNRLEYLTFFVNGVTFAINSLYIDSIASIDNITDVPGSNDSVDGIVYFRGTTIPVINLGKYLFNKTTEDSENQYCVVCKYNDKLYAFRIDTVSSIVTISSRDLIPVDRLLRASCTMLEGFMSDKDRNITEILDIKHIIGQCEQE